MKNTSSVTDYELFCLHILGEKPYLEAGCDFRDICHELGLDAQTLENEIFEELGLGGDELLERFRRGECKRVLHLRH